MTSFDHLNFSRASVTVPGLNKKNHRTTPIEHFLIDIVQILSGDGIEKNNSGHWSLIAPIDIYLSTLWNFISKRWPIIFFTV